VLDLIFWSQPVGPATPKKKSPFAIHQLLIPVYKKSDVIAVHKPVVHVNGHGHGFYTIIFRHLSKRNLGRTVSEGEASCKRMGRRTVTFSTCSHRGLSIVPPIVFPSVRQ